MKHENTSPYPMDLLPFLKKPRKHPRVSKITINTPENRLRAYHKRLFKRRLTLAALIVTALAAAACAPALVG